MLAIIKLKTILLQLKSLAVKTQILDINELL